MSSPARVAACLAAALFAVVFFAASSHAATYSVWSCRGPDGAAISGDAWQSVNGGTTDDCASGGALSARLLRSDSATLHGFSFVAPPGTRVVAYDVHMYASTAKMGNGGAIQSGIENGGLLAPVAVDAGCAVVGCTFGVTDPPLSPANLVTAGGLDAGALSLVAACVRIQRCDDTDTDALVAEVRMFGARVDLRDDGTPAVDASRMPADDQLLAAPTTVSASASDSGGGVAALALMVDGQEVARRDAGGGCAQPYSQAAPCPAEFDGDLALDPAAFAPGMHSVRVLAVDAAGNTATSAAVMFRIGAASAVLSSTGTSGSTAGSTAGTSAAVAPSAAANRRVRIVVRRRVVRLPDAGGGITGFVRDTAGRPLAGVKVTVRSRPFGVHRLRLRRERTLITDARGRFAMPAGKTSRLVVLDVDDGPLRADEQQEVTLLSRLRVSAHANAPTLVNGSTLKVTANVLGAGGGAGGKSVLVQAFVEGRWTTVDSISATSRGTASWAYRFRATTRPTTYLFRVRVERAGDVWPWPTTTSRPLRVVVRPG